MEEFTRTDVHAVDHAMLNAEVMAKEREEKMPSSASALLRHAAELYAVREKILDRLPEAVRETYPPRKLNLSLLEDRSAFAEAMSRSNQ